MHPFYVYLEQLTMNYEEINQRRNRVHNDCQSLLFYGTNSFKEGQCETQAWNNNMDYLGYLGDPLLRGKPVRVSK